MNDPVAAASDSSRKDPFATIPHRLRRYWVWFLALGIALILLGGLAIGASVAATLITVIFIGCVLLCEGALQILASFLYTPMERVLLASGFLAVIVGLLLVAKPVDSAIALTLLMASFFVGGGLFRIVAATLIAFRGRSWMFLGGVVELALGILIWGRWTPQDITSLLWIIGTFVGINLMFRGWSFVVIAMTLRSLPTSSPDAVPH
jgi:uncharacterized membrane protein HdeD (DUF308 family)